MFYDAASGLTGIGPASPLSLHGTHWLPPPTYQRRPCVADRFVDALLASSDYNYFFTLMLQKARSGAVAEGKPCRHPGAAAGGEKE